ncbi:MAG: ATP-binding protein [Thauera sp.]|jgi:magnesium chelatase subunit I|nr:ATP-binding protein [Thauera sp.]
MMDRNAASLVTPPSRSTPALPAHYPFAALIGQSALQTALLLAAVDPRIGGLLIVGPRGTAKSTSARALAALLPELLPELLPDEGANKGQSRFVNLPLGSSEEQLVGSLDLESVLQDGSVRFRPGLLARADGGVLYIDEVNLLADALVDLLLDVSASGINRIERDGISHQHRAAITLIGTMNPEEGELRPQLLDRFGLYLRLGKPLDHDTRQAIVRARLSFDEDPAAFLARYAPAQQALQQRIRAARALLPTIAFDDASHAEVARRCAAAAVEGVRADLVMLRAARAHAALDGRSAISTADIDAVAELVLAHRRQQPDEQAAAEEQPPATEPPPTNPPTADTPPPADRSEAETKGSEGDWGAMAAPAVAISPLKPLRPLQALTPKKP